VYGKQFEIHYLLALRQEFCHGECGKSNYRLGMAKKDPQSLAFKISELRARALLNNLARLEGLALMWPGKICKTLTAGSNHSFNRSLSQSVNRKAKPIQNLRRQVASKIRKSGSFPSLPKKTLPSTCCW